MDNIVRCPFPPFALPTGNFGEEVIRGIAANKGLALVDVSTGRQVSGPELMTQLTRLGASLTSLGCKSGDVIALFSKNSIEWVQVLLGIFYIDAVPAGINHLLKEDELSIHLETCKAVAIFCEQELAHVAIAAVKKLKNHTVRHIIVSGGFNGCLQLEKLIEHDDINITYNPKSFVKKRNGRNLAAIMFSSGTTGLQKAVALAHEALILESMIARDPLTVFAFDKQVVFAPLSHGAGFMRGTASLRTGGALYILPKYELKLFVDTLIKYQIRDIALVPPVALQLAKSPLADGSKLPLNIMTLGAAPVSSELERQLYAKFPGLKIVQRYGMTETTVISTGVPTNSLALKQGSIGIPFHNTEMKIIRIGSGEALGPNQPGEICVRSPLRLIEYIGNPKATKELVDDNDWIHTGDVGYYDEDGYFYVTDRIKELIKFNAFQIAPAELESVVLSHPDVDDVGVVGIPHKDHGEVPLAIVVLKPSVSVTESQLEAFVNGKVAPHKKLRGGVKFVSVIPKTGSGKILRREIRRQLFENKL